MLHLLRHIRQKLILQENIRKYLLYAIGEILLVVIGILIALQVNNWNVERTEQKELQIYYQRIHDELETDIPIQKDFLKKNQEVIDLSRRSLVLLTSEHPDSLKELKHTLGAIATSWSTTLSYPILDEFMENGFLSRVDNPVLKEKFFRLTSSLEFTRMFEDYIQNQYQLTIEPYIIETVNYQAIAMDKYQDWLVSGGPEVDYLSLKKDLKLWNIISLKLEITSQYNEYLELYITQMEEISDLVKKEIH